MGKPKFDPILGRLKYDFSLVDGFYLPASPTAASIIAAAQTARDAGGGIVQLPAGTISISETLPLYTGVTYRGVGVKTTTGNVVNGITIIQPSGAFPAFAARETDEPYGAGVNPTSTQVFNDSLYACGVSDLGIIGGTYGIKLGALRNPGAFNSIFENVYCSNQTEWGFWFENTGYCRFINLRVLDLASGASGMMFFGASSGNQYNYGNNHYEDLFGKSGISEYIRGIVFQARGNGTAFNDLHAYNMQVNQSGSKLTVSNCTGSASSPDIVLPVGTDMTKFKVDYPITFQSGFSSPHIAWFITYSDEASRTIRVSATQGGTATNTATSSTIQIITYGPPCFEISALDNGTSNKIQPGKFQEIDAEGIATNSVLVQNASVGVGIDTTFAGQGTDRATVLCVRKSDGYFTMLGVGQVDIDQSSELKFISQYMNYANDVTTAAPNNSVNGIIYDRSAGGFGLAMGGNPSGVSSALKAINTSGQTFLYPSHPIGQRILNSSSTSLSLNGSQAGCIAYTGAGTATWTLPTIQDVAGGTANSYPGTTFEIVNAGGGTLTLNTNGTQLFNKIAAKTSISIPAGASVVLRAHFDGTSAFWAWVANNGAT